MRIKPKTRLLVYGHQDAVIMKKMEIHDVSDKLRALYKRIQPRIAKYGELSDQEIEDIVQTHRKERVSVH